MNRQYSKELKASITYQICEEKRSTSKVAAENKIPLKTVEKWVTAYNKDKTVYGITCYSDEARIKNLEKTVKQLKRENEILKKTILLVAKNG